VQNWSQTLLSRFADRPAIVGLIASFNAAMDPAGQIQNFYDYIWNVNTAVGNGLDIWGKIVGVSRTIPSPVPVTLADVDYRTLILAKAAANIGNVTVPALNKLLLAIFGGSGLVYVQDNLDMTLSYVFLFQPTPAQQAIVQYSDAIPRPAGVLVNYFWAQVTGPLNTAPLNTWPLNQFAIS
jgi:hypothetical protein